MKTYRITLKPKSRIGRIPSSDTIFGALCWGIRHLYDDINLGAVLQDFNNWERKFIPSSAFPVLQTGDGPVFCYPKPLLLATDLEKGTDKFPQSEKLRLITTVKNIKKVKYLSASIFQQVIKEGNIRTLLSGILENKIVELKTVLLTSNELQRGKSNFIWTETVSMRNKIDRVSFATVPGGELYYEEETYFNPAITELYFILLAEDINFLRPVLRWLEDTGIGGNRTTGAGHYTIEIAGEFSLSGADNGSNFISLSRYLPQADEINWESQNNRYELLRYQSRLDTLWFKGGDFIKKPVTYITEGSILEARQRREYYGTLYPAATHQGNTIYQCGLTVPIFL